nr:unnamed protein product [Haemonchus contortus]
MMKLSDSSRLAGHEKGMVFCTLIVFAFTMLMCTQQTLRGIAVWTENTEFNNWISMHVSDVYSLWHSVLVINWVDRKISTIFVLEFFGN